MANVLQTWRYRPRMPHGTWPQVRKKMFGLEPALLARAEPEPTLARICAHYISTFPSPCWKNLFGLEPAHSVVVRRTTYPGSQRDVGRFPSNRYRGLADEGDEELSRSTQVLLNVAVPLFPPTLKDARQLSLAPYTY